MLDDKAPRSKLEPPSRGSSFYIENLLGSPYRGAFTEERQETPGFKVTVHSPGICAGLEPKRLGEGLNWSGTSPKTTYCTSRSEWLDNVCISLSQLFYKQHRNKWCSHLSVWLAWLILQGWIVMKNYPPWSWKQSRPMHKPVTNWNYTFHSQQPLQSVRKSHPNPNRNPKTTWVLLSLPLCVKHQLSAYPEPSLASTPQSHSDASNRPAVESGSLFIILKRTGSKTAQICCKDRYCPPAGSQWVKWSLNSLDTYLFTFSV